MLGVSNKLSTHESFSYLEWESTTLMAPNENKLYPSHTCLKNNELMLPSDMLENMFYSSGSSYNADPPIARSCPPPLEVNDLSTGWVALYYWPGVLVLSGMTKRQM